MEYELSESEEIIEFFKENLYYRSFYNFIKYLAQNKRKINLNNCKLYKPLLIDKEVENFINSIKEKEYICVENSDVFGEEF